MSTLPETMSKKEFAAHLGVRLGAVTRMAARDRLVLTGDGRRVKVAESIQRLEDTKTGKAKPYETVPETMTRRAFAEYLRVRPSYVTQLIKEDRIALTDDGKRVRVAESVERIEATKDPARSAQRERWERHREQRDGAEPTEPPEPDADVGPYQKSRARREHFQARLAELEYRRTAGELCETEAVRRAATQAGTYLRTALERQADRLAPVVAPVTDEQQMRAMLTEHFEAELRELADGMARLVDDLGGSK